MSDDRFSRRRVPRTETTFSMSELHHECGVAAIYHSARGRTEPALPAARTRGHVAADAADAAGHPEPRATLGRHDHLLTPPGQQLIDTHKELGSVSEVFRLSHRGKSESLMQRVRRPGGHRPRPLRHLRRRRPQLRPAVRAPPSAKAQVVQLRLQRPAGQLRRAARRAAGRRRPPPGPRDRHRNHHARDQPRAVGRPPAAADRGHAERRRSSSTGPTASCSSTPWATCWSPATRWASSRCATRSRGRCSPRPARAWPC